jgi:hypothetical protein
MARARVTRTIGAGLLAAALAVAVGVAPRRTATLGAAASAVVGPSTTVVEGIYPTADRLPANLLRFYIVFSEAMRIGESHTRLRLIEDSGGDDSGAVVSGAFLELDEELWDPSRRRLTVLLDPGRIKRGLRANLESGAPLLEGRRYRLEIDAAWRDGHGRPLLRAATKRFATAAADRTAPDLGRWVVRAPSASGAREPLILRFPEPLDRALLASAVTVEDDAGAEVRGVIEVGDAERTWRFTPQRAWATARHRVCVEPELEDVAGNSLRRLFDVDLTRAARAETNAAVRCIPFDVEPLNPSP